jgi:hypothetical protein
MNDRPELRGRGAPWWGLLLALLLLPLTALPAAAAPSAPAASAPVHAPAPAVLFGSLRRILGDQTAMIQVAVVIGAVAIFWLTRSIGKG